MVDYLISVGVLIGLVSFSAPIYVLLLRIFKKAKLLLLLVSLVIAPLILGELLYLQLFLFPGYSQNFYLINTASLILISWIGLRRSIAEMPREIYSLIRQVVTQFKERSRTIKVLLTCISLIILLALIRMLFWPINWADQIFYIEQSYVFAATRSLKEFIEWGVFRDSQIIHQMNPAIRPGLPMIFSFDFLATKSLVAGQLFAQLVMLYYFILTLILVFYTTFRISEVNRFKNSLTALFFTLTTFLFISHSVYGFKELLIISLILLVVNLASALDLKNNQKLWLLIGSLMGLMSFVNYSGILISLILLLILLIYYSSSVFAFISNGLKAILLIIVIGGFEPIVFLQWVISSSSIKSVVTADIQTANIIANSSPAVVDQGTTSFGAREFSSYGIRNLLDLYIKGKFQGIFQFQYYGAIFILFIVTIISTFRRQINNPISKIILLFILIYSFIFFDPFNLNQNQFGYVLSISYKYTVLLVPFVAILIACQSDWLETKLSKLKVEIIAVLAAAYLLVDFFYIRSNYDRVLKAIGRIMTIHNDPEYYIFFLRLGDNFIVAFAGALLLIVAYVKLKKLEVVWQRNLINYYLFILLLFLVPFLFFFNTNFGVINTFRYLPASKSTKLVNISGWEDMYGMVNDINALEGQPKILFLGQSIGLIELHLEKGISNIQDGIKFPEKTQISKALIDAEIKKNEYVYTTKDAAISEININQLSYLRVISERGKYVLYQVQAD